MFPSLSFVLNSSSGIALASYNMPLAYLLVTFAWMLLWLLAMLRNSASGLKQKMLARAEDTAYACGTLIFASWDYCIEVQINQSINRSLN